MFKRMPTDISLNPVYVFLCLLFYVNKLFFLIFQFQDSFCFLIAEIKPCPSLRLLKSHGRAQSRHPWRVWRSSLSFGGAISSDHFYWFCYTVLFLWWCYLEIKGEIYVVIRLVFNLILLFVVFHTIYFCWFRIIFDGWWK